MKKKQERSNAVRRGWLFLFSRNVVTLVYAVLWRFEKRGRDRIPNDGPLVYVANHTSHLDPPGVGVLVRARPCAFLARKSLFDFKPFGWLLNQFGSVPLDTKRAGISALRAALVELEAGRCVLVFPEGMRTYDGRPGRYRSGFLLLARKANATIVPVGLAGCFDVWPRDRRFPRLRGRLIGEVCEPITPDTWRDLDNDAVVELVKRRIETKRLELRSHVREKTGGRFAPLGPLDRPHWEDEAESGADASEPATPGDAAGSESASQKP